MIKKPKNLYLFTQKFPYCNGENCKGDPYLINELPVLERDFDKIYLIPRLRGDNIRKIPDNAEILSIDYYDINMNGDRGKFEKILDVASLARRYGSLKLLWILLKESFSHVEDKFSIADNLKIISKYFLYSLFIIDKLKINENDTNIFYSYWFNEWTLILSLLVDFGVIEKYVTRAHAKSDLYIDKFTDTILHRYRARKAN